MPNPLPVLLLLMLALMATAVVLRSSLPRHMPPPVVETKLPRLTSHALAHPDARLAWNWVRQHGQFCKWQCPDGRTRFVCGMPNHRWAIVVVRADRLVTAFTADQSYARDVTDGCHNPWHYSHP